MNLFELAIFLLIILGPAIMQWLRENQKRKQQSDPDYIETEEYLDDDTEYVSHDVSTRETVETSDPLADALREIREALGQPASRPAPPPTPVPPTPEPTLVREHTPRSRHGEVLHRGRDVEVPDSNDLVLLRDRSAEDLSKRRADFTRPDHVSHERASLRETSAPIQGTRDDGRRKLSPFVKDLRNTSAAQRAIVLTEVFGPPPSVRARGRR